jgi:hypothetical protein
MLAEPVLPIPLQPSSVPALFQNADLTQNHANETQQTEVDFSTKIETIVEDPHTPPTPSTYRLEIPVATRAELSRLKAEAVLLVSLEHQRVERDEIERKRREEMSLDAERIQRDLENVEKEIELKNIQKRQEMLLVARQLEEQMRDAEEKSRLAEEEKREESMRLDRIAKEASGQAAEAARAKKEASHSVAVEIAEANQLLMRKKQQEKEAALAQEKAL